MRVEVNYRPERMMVDVYVLQEGIGGGVARVWTPTGTGYDWKEVPLGGEMPVSMSVPRDVWEAINAAAADLPMPSRAMADHLADTVGVRDRLLTIVERCTLRPPPADG